jgi:EF-P beta-lysylation protein EpmB
MSHASALALHPEETWQEQLQNALRSPDELAEFLGLSPAELGYSGEADDSFPLLVPRSFAARMRRGDATDPLLRQVLAAPEETLERADYGRDPVAEVSRYGGSPGILQKYSGRALMIVTGQCAVNCRYCFRRHYPYADNAQSSADRLVSVDALLDDLSLRELILSGGDPLLLPDKQISAIAERIQRRQRGVTLRIHTRLPVVIPDRVTETLTEALTKPAMPVVIVLHSNHPNEINNETAAAIGRLKAAGITVLNQAVLLRGVNDTVESLAALSDRLFAAGAMPYYLHLLDKVAGAGHFDVPEDTARNLVGELASIRPGYLVPKLAVEVPGASSKRELAPSYSS